jgi:hypothetical protein
MISGRAAQARWHVCCGQWYAPETEREAWDEFCHWVDLEVIWRSWGCFLFEERGEMWEQRHVQPLFPVAIAIGHEPSATWRATFAASENAPLRYEVNAIRDAFERRTGRPLRFCEEAP